MVAAKGFVKYLGCCGAAADEHDDAERQQAPELTLVARDVASADEVELVDGSEIPQGDVEQVIKCARELGAVGTEALDHDGIELWIGDMSVLPSDFIKLCAAERVVCCQRWSRVRLSG